LRIKEKTNQTSHLSLAPFLISFPKGEGDGDKNGDGEWGVVKIEEARQPEKAYAWNNPFEKRGKPRGVLILHGRLRREWISEEDEGS